MKPRWCAVALGGSAGSFATMRSIVAALPENFALPVFVVLHQPAHPAVSLREAFGSDVRVPLVDADDAMVITPGVVYLAPPDRHLLVAEGGRLALDGGSKVCFVRPSIDVLFESAALAYGAGLVGVVLSGANSDGACGLAAILAAGGHGIVQDPATADFPAMPTAALALAGAAETMAPASIAKWIATCNDGGCR